MRRYVQTIGVALMLAILLSPIGGDSTYAHRNQCSTWATLRGEEGVYPHSNAMHYLGCIDDPWSNAAHYDANYYGEGCTALARTIVRSNPAYFVWRPITVGRMVKHQKPWCTVYEDGSYEDNSTH